jgi:hypothetical protein
MTEPSGTPEEPAPGDEPQAPVTAPRKSAMVLETVGGGLVAAITGGLIGVLLGKAIGGTSFDSAEGEIVLGLMGGVAGAAAGLIGGVAGVLHAYHSDSGARRRFWFTVLASFFSVLLLVPRWENTAGRLLRAHPGQYYYRKCCLNFPAGVLPLISGVVGYLLGLLNDDPATRSQPAHKRKRLVAVYLLLVLLAAATLLFFVCRTR